jgi:hypothetical protein
LLVLSSNLAKEQDIPKTNVDDHSQTSKTYSGTGSKTAMPKRPLLNKLFIDDNGNVRCNLTQTVKQDNTHRTGEDLHMIGEDHELNHVSAFNTDGTVG